MLEASSRQLNFALTLKKSSEDFVRKHSQSKLAKEQKDFDHFYGNPAESRCPFLRSTNWVRARLGWEPVTRPDKSGFQQGSESKKKRYEDFKKLVHFDDSSLLRDCANFRYPGNNLGISAADTEKFESLVNQGIEIKALLDFIGGIITRNVGEAIAKQLEKCQADPGLLKEFSKERMQELLQVNILGGFTNAVSTQLEYFRNSFEKLRKVCQDEGLNLNKSMNLMLKNNLRILQQIASLQFGQFRALLNSHSVLSVDFEDEKGDYSSNRTDFAQGYEIRSMPGHANSPVMVPKESFIDILEQEFVESTIYTDGGSVDKSIGDSAREIDQHGHARGCLANELIFPAEMREDFKDISAEDNDGKLYHLEKNLFNEFAEYVSEIVEHFLRQVRWR